MLNKWLTSGVLILLLVSLCSLAFAQETTVRGYLSGIVSDSTGAVVSDARVTINGPTGKRAITTTGDGRFFSGPLTPGYYSVNVEKEGFRTAEVKGIEVSTGKTASVSVPLQPGAVSETVEVSAAAITVDTASTAIGDNLNDTFYSKVPVGRNVTSLFYASVGVNSGGGTGSANPSISGGSGLENQYVADGVSITDGAFGGLGVYTVNYGSLSTGINLSFVKEVQVKTGGYEPQYGKSTGGLVQIVTKSGSTAFHGGISGFYSPQAFEAGRLQPDDFNRLNEQGRVLHNGGYDLSGEIGGYVPGFRDHLFFFGSFNPSWTRQYGQLADLHGVYAFPLVATKHNLGQLAYNYAAKLTWKLTDKHQLESSIFGDPTRSNIGPFQTLETFSDTTFSKLANGTRNWVARYNGTLSPSWLLNSSFAWGHNYLTETPSAPNEYQVSDFTGCGVPPGSNAASSCPVHLVGNTLNGPAGPISGLYVRQGLGFYENTEGNNHSLNFDTQKIVTKLGSHAFSIGYHYEWSDYAGARARSGARFTITPKMATAINFPAAVGTTSNAAGFSIRLSPTCAACPLMTVPGLGDQKVILRQSRGEFGDPNFDTNGRYHAAYVNDAWTINRHVTVNVGWRWEQQMLQGTPFTNIVTGGPVHSHYTFTDNWSPRIGLSIDPKGDRKTKVYGNFARYSYAIPLDMAIRSLSNELDFATSEWFPVSSGGRVVINPDGTIANPILDDAHFRRALTGISSSLNPDGTPELIAPGTKMQYLQEWVAGVQHEFPKGIVVDVRWIDRRIKRIVEDIAGISPEAFNAGLNQIYTITNPTAGTDLYINPIQVLYPSNGGAFTPAACPVSTVYGGIVSLDPVQDTTGATVAPGGMCIANPDVAGTLGKDGKPDGFVNPVRVYKAIEFELNKAFSAGWQVRANYRWSQLNGNYEGAFRNDNGQSDPNISSLFDFIRGDFNLLGQQFQPGWLNTDRRHIINGFVSYSFTHSFLKNLTLGTGVRVETGIPINDLRAHPAYQNAGEIPVGGRGSLGRTPTDGQADVHADYAIKLNEKHSVHFGTDMFNITNQKTQLRVDQNEDRNFLIANADFKKPTQGNLGFNPQLGFQRPFNARIFVKWIF